MEGVGHSPLLKFIVADSKIRTMSEPEFQIQVSFDNPNITSSVPGEQRFRDASESNLQKVSRENITEDIINIVDDVFDAKTYAKNTDGKDKMAEVEPRDEEDSVTQTSKEEFVLTPVMTVTKEEAVLTKGNTKLQRVSVTEDVSVRFQHLFKKQTLPGKTVVTEIQKFEYKY